MLTNNEENMKSVITTILLNFIIVVSLSQTVSNSISDEDKILGLSTFWKEASYNFVYFDKVPTLNWDSTYTSYIPKVLATKNLYEYYRELQKFCALLKDGHTQVDFPIYIYDSLCSPKIKLTAIYRHAFVTNVGKSLQKEIPVGSEIIEVNGQILESYLKEYIFPYISSSSEDILWLQAIQENYLLSGKINTKVVITIKKPDGKMAEVKITRNNTNDEWAEKKEEMKTVEFKWLENNIAYVAINSFRDTGVVTKFKKILPELYLCRGLIIDIRNNSGGNDSFAQEITKYLTNKNFMNYAIKKRINNSYLRAVGSLKYLVEFTGNQICDEKIYKVYENYLTDNAWEIEEADTIINDNNEKKIIVPTAVLIGPIVQSAAEDFLVYMDKIETITIIGQKTTGSTGQGIYFKLPGGGLGVICAVRDTYSDGRNFAGYGISPAIEINPTLQDYLNKKDLILNHAIDYLKTSLKQTNKK